MGYPRLFSVFFAALFASIMQTTCGLRRKYTKAADYDHMDTASVNSTKAAWMCNAICGQCANGQYFRVQRAMSNRYFAWRLLEQAAVMGISEAMKASGLTFPGFGTAYSFTRSAFEQLLASYGLHERTCMRVALLSQWIQDRGHMAIAHPGDVMRDRLSYSDEQFTWDANVLMGNERSWRFWDEASDALDDHPEQIGANESVLEQLLQNDFPMGTLIKALYKKLKGKGHRFRDNMRAWLHSNVKSSAHSMAEYLSLWPFNDVPMSYLVALEYDPKFCGGARGGLMKVPNPFDDERQEQMIVTEMENNIKTMKWKARYPQVFHSSFYAEDFSKTEATLLGSCKAQLTDFTTSCRTVEVAIAQGRTPDDRSWSRCWRAESNEEKLFDPSMLGKHVKDPTVGGPFAQGQTVTVLRRDGSWSQGTVVESRPDTTDVQVPGGGLKRDVPNTLEYIRGAAVQ